MTFRELEQLAIDAHARGDRWSTFWPSVADDVRRMASYDRRAYHRLVDRLLSTLVSGEDSGIEPPGNGDWELGEDEGEGPLACPRPTMPLAAAVDPGALPTTDARAVARPRTTRKEVYQVYRTGAAESYTRPFDTCRGCQPTSGNTSQHATQ
jgi:hypothetical protein